MMMGYAGGGVAGVAWFGMEDDGATLHGLDKKPMGTVLDFLTKQVGPPPIHRLSGTERKRERRVVLFLCGG